MRRFYTYLSVPHVGSVKRAQTLCLPEEEQMIDTVIVSRILRVIAQSNLAYLHNDGVKFKKPNGGCILHGCDDSTHVGFGQTGSKFRSPVEQKFGFH